MYIYHINWCKISSINSLNWGVDGRASSKKLEKNGPLPHQVVNDRCGINPRSPEKPLASKDGVTWGP